MTNVSYEVVTPVGSTVVKSLQRAIEIVAEKGGSYKTIIEDLGVSWVDIILGWDWYKFNEYFEGLFYLNVEQVYKAE